MATYTGRRGFVDDREAARLFKLAADQGYAEGQRDLGILYADGRSVPKDDREAARLTECRRCLHRGPQGRSPKVRSNSRPLLGRGGAGGRSPGLPLLSPAKLVIDRWPSHAWMARVSCPLLARAYPQAWRSMCGCAPRRPLPVQSSGQSRPW
jgi:hypothetical protein